MKRGFTLTEVLAGLFILGLIAVFTLPNINRALAIERNTQDNVGQVLYLKSVMSRIKGNLLENKDPEIGVEKKDGFTYDYKIEGQDGLEKLTVEVRDHEEKSMELEVFLRR